MFMVLSLQTKIFKQILSQTATLRNEKGVEQRIKTWMVQFRQNPQMSRLGDESTDWRASLSNFISLIRKINSLACLQQFSCPGSFYFIL